MEQRLAMENLVPGQKGTVYIVDDDDSVRDSLCILLESKGFDVEPFHSALEYLDRASSSGNDNACMLLDVHMPGMDGIELMTRMRNDKHKVPVIAMTGLRDDLLRARARAAGAVALFDKPLEATQLVEVITAALRLP